MSIKIKTHKGAAKRFKKTGKGKFKRGCSHQRHLLTSKAPKRKRQLDMGSSVSKADQATVAKLLPYA